METGSEPTIGKQFQFGQRFNNPLLPSFLLSHISPSMDDAKSPISTLRRRNSTGESSNLTVNTKNHHPSSSSSTTTTTTTTTTTSSYSSADFELLSLKPASYTSLRDILPSTAVQSPKVPSFAVHSGYEIPIRNRLVKQAAWAYLRPMSTSPDSGGSTVFHRLWNRFSDACLRLLTQIFDCFLQSTIQLRTTTTRL